MKTLYFSVSGEFLLDDETAEQMKDDFDKQFEYVFERVDVTGGEFGVDNAEFADWEWDE